MANRPDIRYNHSDQNAPIPIYPKDLQLTSGTLPGRYDYMSLLGSVYRSTGVFATFVPLCISIPKRPNVESSHGNEKQEITRRQVQFHDKSHR